MTARIPTIDAVLDPYRRQTRHTEPGGLVALRRPPLR